MKARLTSMDNTEPLLLRPLYIAIRKISYTITVEKTDAKRLSSKVRYWEYLFYENNKENI